VKKRIERLLPKNFYLYVAGILTITFSLSVMTLDSMAINEEEKQLGKIPEQMGDQVDSSAQLIPASPQDTSIFLPFVTRPYEFLALGNATLTGGPTACPGFPDQNCYDLQVTCSQLVETLNVTLRVGDPTSGVSTVGTMIFFSGFDGTYFWDGIAGIDPVTGEPTSHGQENFGETPASPDGVIYEGIITDLRANGFRTVQLDWAKNWFQAKADVPEGLSKLACRPATIMKWTYDNLHGGDEAQPFCAEGHSNGASQLAYNMTRYGMAEYLDLAVFESGPNWTRIDQSCIQDDPAFSDIFFLSSSRNLVDISYGYFDAQDPQPCTPLDSSYRSILEYDSLGLGSWQFSYPNTMVAFLFGELDLAPNPPATRNSGRRFSDLLVANNTPLWMRLDLPDSGHIIGNDPDGKLALENTLISQCIVR